MKNMRLRTHQVHTLVCVATRFLSVRISSSSCQKHLCGILKFHLFHRITVVLKEGSSNRWFRSTESFIYNLFSEFHKQNILGRSYAAFFLRLAQWYSAGLRAVWSVVRVPAGAGNFSLHHDVEMPAMGSTQPPIQWVPRVLFLWVKQPRREANRHLHPVQRLRILGTIPPLPQYAFMAWCSVTAEGQLYLYIFQSTNIYCCLLPKQIK
jgi:hypothetical protein